MTPPPVDLADVDLADAGAVAAWLLAHLDCDHEQGHYACDSLGWL